MRSILSVFAPLSLSAIPIAASANAEAEEIITAAAAYTVKIQVQNDVAFNQDEAGSASGTGFLIDRKRGWLLTNAHVATRSPSVIKVSFKGGDQILAKRIHVDPLLDLAILAIPIKSIPETAIEASLACDEIPTAGTSVLAYGHPWGLSYTASRGIVSGLAWFYPNQLIQTDAAINSGNSGGPLIRLTDGRVVGINTSTYQPDGSDKAATAISLAEPITNACRIIELLKAGTDTRLKMLPIATAVAGDDLRPRVARVYQEDIALESGDIITKVNGGRTVSSLSELLSDLRGVSDEARVTIQRKGKQFDVRTPVRTVADPLKVRSINLSGLIISQPWRLDDMEVNPRRYLFVDWYETGEEAALSEARLDDYIVSVDGREFQDVDQLYRYLENLAKDATVELVLMRATAAAEFYREYSVITLSRHKLEWVYAE